MLSKLRNNEVDLYYILRAEETPDRLLHHFSYDCAQRALLRAERAGWKIPSRVRTLIAQKRAWLEGHCNFDTLTPHHQLLEEAIPTIEDTAILILTLLAHAASHQDASAGAIETAQQAKNLAAHEARDMYYASAPSPFGDPPPHQISNPNWTDVFTSAIEHLQEVHATLDTMTQQRANSDKAAEAAAHQEHLWQCRRFAFLLEISLLTERLWLIYQDPALLPIPLPQDAKLTP